MVGEALLPRAADPGPGPDVQDRWDPGVPSLPGGDRGHRDAGCRVPRLGCVAGRVPGLSPARRRDKERRLPRPPGSWRGGT